jgi:hypothetical protein
VKVLAAKDRRIVVVVAEKVIVRGARNTVFTTLTGSSFLAVDSNRETTVGLVVTDGNKREND